MLRGWRRVSSLVILFVQEEITRQHCHSWNRSISISCSRETASVTCQRVTHALVWINLITRPSFDCGLACYTEMWETEEWMSAPAKQTVWLIQIFYNTAGLDPPSVRAHPCVCVCETHSLSRGTEVRLLLFWTMLAWFRREMRRVDGASRHGSPSTWTERHAEVMF